MSLYNESLKYNNCLHKKLSIDQFGNIKNCPSCEKVFGNIYSSKLAEVVHLSEFKELWNIDKSKIQECTQCEFRYICVDCRAFLPQNTNFNKPKKCNYDPFAAASN